MVEKRFVVVALVEVELMAVKFWRVLEPLAKMLPKVPSPVEAMELTESKPLASIVRAGVEEVAKVEALEVARYRMTLAFLKDQ